MGEHESPGKPFDISKQEVWQAYQKVAANKGAAGVDMVSLEEFESDLKSNLYKIWNRMSSGSYFPPPVRAVEIPKAHGAGTRVLGVPTVGDRIAQTVVAGRIESAVEPKFHPDSYGYRPGRGALDAVGKCRERCWSFDWVIDLDVQKFFDTVPWDRIVAAVEANIALPWVILYVKRWLAAPIRMPDGTLAERDRGTPQGSAVSPVLANLFMHYAFDLWMAREFPGCPFERYADDAVVHCRTKAQADFVLDRLRKRMEQVGVRLHPEKTRIVYCKDGMRRGSHEHTEFTFLGFTYRARGVRAGNGNVFTGFGSDRGSNYTSGEFAAVLAELGIRQSVGRTGICYDNALSESVNASLKVELVHRKIYVTRKKAREDIARWIELRLPRSGYK